MEKDKLTPAEFIAQEHKEFSRLAVLNGCDEVSMEEFLEWIVDKIREEFE